MDPLLRIALVFPFLGVCCFLYFRSVKSGKTTTGKLRYTCLAAMILSAVALLLFLFVIAPRVPGTLKDGTFGGAGGIVMCMLVCNAFLASALLARLSGEAATSSRHDL